MKVLGIILLGAVIGAIGLTIAWLLYAFFILFPSPGYNTGWSGAEPLILAPLFLLAGAFLGGVVGMFVGLYKSRGAT